MIDLEPLLKQGFFLLLLFAELGIGLRGLFLIAKVCVIGYKELKALRGKSNYN